MRRPSRLRCRPQILLLLLLYSAFVASPEPNPATVSQWQNRKFGMFIHFGLFSKLGGVWNGKQYSGNYSEQIQSDAHIPEPEYAALAKQFNPTAWNPDAIVQLAIDAGMKFIVLTAKHHDGFSLFATQQSNYNVAAATPYQRDIVKSLADACHRRAMPFGVYYSSIDWHYGDIPDHRNDNPLSKAHEAFNVAQLTELLSNYGPISEVWFDMSHPTRPQSARFAATVHALQPQCMVSGRVFNAQGDFNEMGDDAIPEYIAEEPWEAPASIYAETWGYRSWQKRVPLEDKIHEHILRLVKVTSRGGNYLLNIGPKGDGSVVDHEAGVLRGIGQWVTKNAAAIYDTSPQPFRHLDFGYATTKSDHLYLFVERLPVGGRLRLPQLQNRILSASWLNGAAANIKLDNGPERAATIDTLPPNEFLSVLDLKLNGPVNVVPNLLPLDANGAIQLAAADADKMWNENGEGYWDKATLRSLRWRFAVEKNGSYQITMQYRTGKFSRVVDVAIDGTVKKVLLYGDIDKPASAGSATLSAGQPITLSIRPASPAERGAPLDVEIIGISLKYTGP